MNQSGCEGPVSGAGVCPGVELPDSLRNKH